MAIGCANREALNACSNGRMRGSSLGDSELIAELHSGYTLRCVCDLPKDL